MINTRPRIGGAALVALFTLLVPAVALAAGGHGFDPKVHGLYILAFLVTFIPIIIFVGPKLQAYLKGNYDAIKADIDEATGQFKEAEAGLKTAKERLENLNAEIEQMMGEFKALGEKERDALAHDGAVMSEKIRGEADFHISQAVKMAQLELREAVIEQSMVAVEKKLAAQAQKSIPKYMVDGFVREIEKDEAKA